jgi:hypothetical protein
MLLTRRSVFRLAAGLPILAVEATRAFAFASKEFWESKPSTEWSAEEVDRMLTKSPWAKDASIAYNSGPGGLGRGAGGGTGRSRGGLGFPGGIGFPGGGMGYPGGGTRGNGGGQPGGLGYPGGNGGGGTAGSGNDGGRPSGGGGERGFRGTVRWESALPVQEALDPGSSDKKPNPDFAKYYVLALIGDLPMVGGRRRGANDSNDDDDSVQDERRQEMFKQYTKLERKDGPVRLEKIEEGSRVGSKGPGTYFYFSRLDDISMDDKQVTFSTKLGPMEIRTKFTLKDMLYHGKLAL